MDGDCGHVRPGDGARFSARRALALVTLLALAPALLSSTASAASAKARSHVEFTKGGGSDAEFTCQAITIHYFGFPDLPGNTVRERVRIDNVRGAVKKVFVFNGPEGTDTIPINLPPGRHRGLDVFAIWKTNGIKGNHDQPHHGRFTCEPEPALAIEKLQKLGSESGYTAAPLGPVPVGETVDYEITVTNAGNVPLTLADLSDPKCDPGTITGGPGENPLAPQGPTTTPGSTVYFCRHVITQADSEAGFYTNVADATGTPLGCEGPFCVPVTAESNTVLVTVPLPPPPPKGAFTIEKLQKISGPFTKEQLAGEVGQTVDYEIIVTNTGSTPLTFSNFSDEHCDAGTIVGGPGTKALAAGESTIYTCSHQLTTADQTAGRYENVAADTGEALETEGSPITETSNTVVVTVRASTTPPAPAPKSEALPSTSSGTSTTTPSGGVLPFAGEAPSLSGPRACVRRGFAASIRAAGVKSVSFYLDGHRLTTLTAKNARHGALTVFVSLARLGTHAHKLLAKITMTPKTASTKPSHVTRSLRVARCSSASTTPRFAG
jgi:hypothetical protein